LAEYYASIDDKEDDPKQFQKALKQLQYNVGLIPLYGKLWVFREEDLSEFAFPRTPGLELFCWVRWCN
jgi:hypothetical protein